MSDNASVHHMPPLEKANEANLTYAQQKVRSGIEFGAYLAYENSRLHGFWEEYEETLRLLGGPDLALGAKYIVDIKLSKMALIGSELGEAVEGVRKPGPDQHVPEFTQEEVELADVIIRAFDFAGKYDLRLGQAVIAKMGYNASRPYKHGKKA